MKTILLVLVFATSVSAQTVERSVDLRDLGWGNVALRAIVELDGDPATTEGLFWSDDYHRYRVAAETPLGLCAGPWFTPDETERYHMVIARIDGIDKMVVSRYDAHWEPTVTDRVALDLPRCW